MGGRLGLNRRTNYALCMMDYYAVTPVSSLSNNTIKLDYLR